MSAKISIVEIVKNHYSTYRDASNKYSKNDIATMIVIPVFTGIVISILKIDLSSAYDNIVTVGALFAGLLLNLLMLIYDQKTKIMTSPPKGDDAGYKEFSIRKTVIDEVHFNISYGVLVSLLVVIVATIGSVIGSAKITINIAAYSIHLEHFLINLPLVIFSTHLIFVLLMILKRVHKLISSHN